MWVRESHIVVYLERIKTKVTDLEFNKAYLLAGWLQYTFGHP
jgi:uncharacterized sodium:solute symporter family permease YidK